MVEGIENMLDLISPEERGIERNMADLSMVTGALPVAGKRALEQAIWRVVEIASKQGVLPLIMPIDRNGNLVERGEN